MTAPDTTGVGDVVAQAAGASSSMPLPAPGNANSVSWAVLNPRSSSKTVHAVVLPKDVYSCCSWSFQGRAEVVALETLRGRGFELCGICYGERTLFE